MLISIVSSLIGFLILVMRLAPVLRSRKLATQSFVSIGKPGALSAPVGRDDLPDANLTPAGDPVRLLSLIIPARNEATNLPRLFRSILECSTACAGVGWRLEVIVVDDQSIDETLSLSNSFRDQNPQIQLKVVAGQDKPAEWTGKNWACHQGYLVSLGEYILFTDADTEQLPDGWLHVLTRMHRESIDMLSAVPYHRCVTRWERYLGVYQLLIIISTAAFSRPRPRRLFAIGQFLLFRRESYAAQNGHEAIRATLADDLELARLCMKRGGHYAVEGLRPVFRVRMYDTFGAFLRGWRRIFRLGFYHSSVVAVIEMYFLIALLTANMRFGAAPWPCQILALSAIIIFWRVQRRYGDFEALGAVLWPWSVLLFIWVSSLAFFDLIFSRRFEWRGREYLTSGEG